MQHLGDGMTHTWYYDHGHSDWVCIDCADSTDACDHEHTKTSNTDGCIKADRYPMGLPGQHPAFKAWAQKAGL